MEQKYNACKIRNEQQLLNIRKLGTISLRRRKKNKSIIKTIHL